MSWKTYDYECEYCAAGPYPLERRWEATVEYEDRDNQMCPDGHGATRLMCAPAVHTLETRMRGYKDDNYTDGKKTGQGYWNPGFGEFIDENLTDPNTGQPARYSSLKEREKLMEKYGKYDLNDINAGKATAFNKPRDRNKPMIFTKEGGKGSTSRVK